MKRHASPPLSSPSSPCRLARRPGLLLAPRRPPAPVRACGAAARKPPSGPSADGARAFAHVTFLASDELKGRKSGTPEYRRAAEYVAAEMQKAGLEPGGDNGTWFQEVPFKSWSDFEQPIRLEIVAPRRRVYFAGRGRDFTPVNGTGSGTVRGGLGLRRLRRRRRRRTAGTTTPGSTSRARSSWSCPTLPASLGERGQGRPGPSRSKVKTGRREGRRRPHRDGPLDPGEPRRPAPRLRPASSAPARRPRASSSCGPAAISSTTPSTSPARAGRDLVSKIAPPEKPVTARPRRRRSRWRPISSRATGPRPTSSASCRGRDRQAQGRGRRHRRPPRPPRRRPRRLDLPRRGRQRRLGRGHPGDRPGPHAPPASGRPGPSSSAPGPARSSGLQGSRWYTEHPVVPLDKTVLYMNIDMVGTGDSDLLVGGLTEFAELYDDRRAAASTPEIVAEAPAPARTTAAPTTPRSGAKNVPAVSLRTGRDPDREARRRASRIPHARRPAGVRSTPSSCALAGQYHCDILQHLGDDAGRTCSTPIHRTMFLHRDAAWSSTCTATRSAGPWPART
ncbi:MAG: hypothetical protein MZU79_07350 [Anaerotruncus sp.]|nr:hypothetical protein [Anaerotruncus sp.]